MSPVKKIANASADAPGATQIQSLQGLVWWLVDKFGPGGIFIVAAWIMYGDQRKDREAIETLLRDSITAENATSTELSRITATLHRMENNM